MTSPHIDPAKAGLKVRHVHNPSKIGETTGEVRFRAGREVATIRLTNGEIAYIAVDLLEIQPENEGRLEAFANSRIGGADDLAQHVLTQKLSGELTDIYYSMESGRADFYPHQFRPVLKFVESTGRRLLIADEVGLGKTISAIYIWKELQARGDARRLLIVCPAVLREKWRFELQNRFSISARFLDASTLQEDIQGTLRDPLNSFVGIGSIEGLRSRQQSHDVDSRTSRQKLMRLLQDHAGGEFSLFDLVVVDEAHAARNSETANYHLVEALRDATASLLLLTATPLQTRAENLFTLLKLIDPDRFPSYEAFEHARRANIPIISSLNALLQVPPDIKAFRRYINAAIREPLFRQDDFLREIARSVDPTWSEEQRVRTARAIESRSLLADVMVRTRKRDAFEKRVLRKPWVLNVDLTQEERLLYESISERVRSASQRERPGTPAEFVLIARQRQLASCIPAALENWKHSGHLDELLWEDIGVELDELDGSGPEVILDDLVTKHDFERRDSKYAKFSEAILEQLRERPEEKIVVFAFFRATLFYLKRRLEADGVACALIYGSMDAGLEGGTAQREVDPKLLEIERFRQSKGPSVLLSSEVGSEGIDLQFARIVFNYDLPWNPMRVEQRIGRLDRMGQTNDVIIVGHFASEGTIDDRILNRLYERVNVFKESIGDLDEIFGEEIQNIVTEYFRGNLTEEEVQLQFDRGRIAEEFGRQAKEELEREATVLAGHTDYILRSISKSHNAQNYPRPEDLRRYVTKFLHERYPGSEIESDEQEAALARITLSGKARDLLGFYIEQHRPVQRTRLAAPGARVAVNFDPSLKIAVGRIPELIDITHPLVLWIRHELSNHPLEMVPAVAVHVPPNISTLAEGSYLFAIDTWRLEGIKRLATLQYCVVHAETGTFLSQDASQELLQATAEHGRRIEPALFSTRRTEFIDFLSICENRLVDEFLQEADLFETENEGRLEQSRQILLARAERLIGNLQSTLNSQLRYTDERRRRIVRATEARLRNAVDDRDTQLARIERHGKVEHSRKPVVGGLIVVGGKSYGQEIVG